MSSTETQTEKPAPVRTRLQQALWQMLELANASANNPALDGDYQRAVAEVAAAEAAQHEATP